MHMPRRLLLASLALLALLPALAACGLFGDDLGPDELPEEITAKHREQIQDTLERFFAGVDAYNPQRAGDAMLIPADLGIEAVAKMALEIGALQSAELQYGFQSVAGMSREGDGVAATAITDLGAVRVVVVRRDGEWRVSEVPRLAVAPEHLPFEYEWRVTNRYGESRGSTVIVGEFVNTGHVPMLALSFGGEFTDPTGRTRVAAVSGVLQQVIIAPDERIAFRVDFAADSVDDLADDRFRLIPNMRIAHDADVEGLTSRLKVDPPTVATLGDAESFEVTVTNEGDDRRLAFVAAVFRDGAGEPLALYVVTPGELDAGAVAPLVISGFAEGPRSAAESVDLYTWAGLALPEEDR